MTLEHCGTYERVGVTGARSGLTAQQEPKLTQALTILRDGRGAMDLHHGDCVGADALAAEIAEDLGYRVVSHPPVKDQFRANQFSHEVREPTGYRARDRQIVDEVELLIALPNCYLPIPGSGTWYTIGYAQSVGRPLLYIWPDGQWSNHDVHPGQAEVAL